LPELEEKTGVFCSLDGGPGAQGDKNGGGMWLKCGSRWTWPDRAGVGLTAEFAPNIAVQNSMFFDVDKAMTPAI
jgi:hypothetical protein